MCEVQASKTALLQGPHLPLVSCIRLPPITAKT